MTKVYRYGLLPPTVGAERIAEQIRLAHRYQNALVEIDRWRRTQARAVLSRQGSVALHEQLVADGEAQLTAHRATIQRTRGETTRRAVAPEIAERTRAIVAGLKQARAALKQAKVALREDAEVRAQMDAITAEATMRSKAARAACGIYWGTYLQIEAAMDAARRSPMDPHFRRWTGEGSVAVQCQGGLAVADLLAGGDTRIQIDAHAQPVPGRGGKPRPRVRLRIGSTETRDPVWGEWPVILHRPLPVDARLKGAKVIRRRLGPKDEWSLHVTLEWPADQRPVDAESCGAGTVAVDLGWRQDADTLRAGGWTDGETSGEIHLDPAVRAMLRKAADIRSIRDQRQNDIRTALVAWRDSVGTLGSEHAEALRMLPAWQSPARFAALARWWRDHRHDGDAVILPALEAWRRRDKHLWLYEIGTRRRAVARRRDQYRVLAATLARRYRTLVIERLDLRVLAAIPAPESERESVPKGRAQRVETAPSELRTALVNAFRARGGEVASVAPTGPAAALLAAWRERRDVVEMPVIARTGRFKRLRGSAPGSVTAETLG
jgi:hypothetical protein